MMLENAIVEDDAAVERLSYIFLDWMNNCEHKRCYVIKVSGANLYLSGYNHHDKLNRRRAYPVFSEFNPHIYYEKKTLEIISRFSNNNVELFKQCGIIHLLKRSPLILVCSYSKRKNLIL